MKLFNKSACAALLFTFAIVIGMGEELAASDETFRILSWNISGDAFVAEQSEFRSHQEMLPEFLAIVPYPDEGRHRILAAATPDKHSKVIQSMDNGIPINGAVILIDDQRLLVVITDLQCCGDGPDRRTPPSGR
jgi:hypothetical protein